MNEIIDNFDELNEEFQDNWLSDNLKSLQMEPSQDFTKNVIEQIQIRPNP